MKCSICKSTNTNSSTCPLNPNAKKKDFKKHYNYKKLYFNTNNMNDMQKKYCRCVLHVMGKNDEKCLKTKNWNSSNKCYNPYSICAKSVGTTTGTKSCKYNLNKVPINELEKYIYFNETKFKKFMKDTDISVSKIYNDKKLFRKYAIKWYNSKIIK